LPADVVILDEAGFVEDGMFYDFLFPLWGVDKTVGILVSTPPKTWTPFLTLLYETHPKTGEHYTLSYTVDMKCDSCKKKKTRKTYCRHQTRKYLPDHKSAEKLDIAKFIYKDKESYNREFL
jgi:hypothetical protein